MSDNLVLDLLRAIRSDIADLRADNVEFRERIGGLEQSTASLSRRVDRVIGNVEQIKPRLNLVDANQARIPRVLGRQALSRREREKVTH